MLEEKIGPFTQIKLNALKNNLSLCLDALNRSDLDFVPVGDVTRGDCNLKDQVTLQKSNYTYSQIVRGKCDLIVALKIWEENVLKPLVKKHLNSELVKINHAGIFSCRNISGSSRRSQHAYANAIDISGFILKDGDSISILRDWNKNDNKSAFLKDVHKQSCQIFSGVLGPNYNAAHRDHFHLDLGPYKICR